jgi:hypothetical protein
MAQLMELADELGSLALFADLSGPQLEAAAHSFEEVWFGESELILREGLTGCGFYVILDGQVSEHVLPGHPFHDFATPEHRRALASLLSDAGVDAAADAQAAPVT